MLQAKNEAILVRMELKLQFTREMLRRTVRQTCLCLPAVVVQMLRAPLSCSCLPVLFVHAIQDPLTHFVRLN